MCLHLDGEHLLFALQELWPIGLCKRRPRKRQRVSAAFSFSLCSCPPPSFIKAAHHTKWHQPQRVSDKTIAWSLRKELAAVHVLSLYPSSPPSFCFLSVHPISQMKLNLVCSVSNSLFLSLFSSSLAAPLPCPSSALQLQVLFYVALEQERFLGLPLFFPVSGLLP